MPLKATVEIPVGESIVKTTFEVISEYGTANEAAVSQFVTEAMSKIMTIGKITPSTITTTPDTSENKAVPEATSNAADTIRKSTKRKRGDPSVQLNVSSVGETIAVTAPVDATISAVKELIHAQTAEPPEQQSLVSGGEIIANNRVLIDVIGEKFKIHLTKVFNITIEAMDGRIVKAKVASSNTVRDIKAKCEVAFGIPIPRQRLYFDAMPLCESRTLDQARSRLQ